MTRWSDIAWRQIRSRPPVTAHHAGSGPDPADGDINVSGRRLAELTAAKTVTNTAMRWIPFFLPTLATAMAASTGEMTAALGVGEMAGLSTLLIGGMLDRGRELNLIVAGLGLTTAGSLLATSGSYPVFALAYVIIILGVSVCTVSGHAYLSRRVRYRRRARYIGTFETSWALGLLLGAPLAAVLIAEVGWRGPFLAVAGTAVVMAAVLVRSHEHSVPFLEPAPETTAPASSINEVATGDTAPGRLGHSGLSDAETSAMFGLSTGAWLTIAASTAIAICGLTTVVIAGTWMDESLGVSTGGVGAVAIAFGLAELTASSASAAVADRVGPQRATRWALATVVVGLMVMTRAGSSLPVGAGGLFLFFVGFEFSIVTSFSIVSEAMPSARGRVLAVNNATGTVMRGLGVTASGLLYERFGVSGPAAVSITAALLAVVLLLLVERRIRP